MVPVCPSGEFQLTDPSGLPAGLIQVSLKWKSTYVPPSGSIRTVTEEAENKPTEQQQVEEEKKDKEETLQEEDKPPLHQPISLPEVSASKVRRHINNNRDMLFNL